LLEIQQLASGAVAQALAGRNLNQTLSAVWHSHPRLSSAERGAIQDLSFGTLRYYGLLEALLRKLSHKPISDEPLRVLLLVALYQLIHTRAKPYAVVDYAVRVTGSLGKPYAKSFANAVLRNFLRNGEALVAEVQQDDIARWNHPRWWITKLQHEYPHDWESILKAGDELPPMTLRVNRRRCSVEEYLHLLDAAGLAAEALQACALRLSRPVPVDRLPGFVEGIVSVQDLSAQYAARLLDVADGMRVCDACSAPGGKSAHLLETAAIDLLALDADAERLHRVAQTLARLDLPGQALHADAVQVDTWWDGRYFDRILVDAPCTGSGVVRRHPDIKWSRRPSDIGEFVGQQRALLDALWHTLRHDGKLLYVTCSVFQEENQQQLADFLSRHRDAQPLPLDQPNTINGQILPDDLHDGFFYALLAKVPSA
jgi:16S rRNA (cytosine967-C5)-methyltransferase